MWGCEDSGTWGHGDVGLWGHWDSGDMFSWDKLITNLQTFLVRDYANWANTHRKFRTTSPQLFRKADPKVFVEDRQSMKGSDCNWSFCIQFSVDSPPSWSFQARLEELGLIHTNKKISGISNFLENRTTLRGWLKFSIRFSKNFFSIWCGTGIFGALAPTTITNLETMAI